MEENTEPVRNIAYDLYPPVLHPAEKGLRLANYIIDIIAYYLAVILFAGMIGIIVGLTSGDTSFFDKWIEEEDSILDRILGMVLYGFFMGVTEGIFYGKTLGKLITKTRAVDRNGNDVTFVNAIMRGLCRIIPFEVISLLFNNTAWHDSITDTIVVAEKQLKDYRDRQLIMNPELNTQ